VAGLARTPRRAVAQDSFTSISAGLAIVARERYA